MIIKKSPLSTILEESPNTCNNATTSLTTSLPSPLYRHARHVLCYSVWPLDRHTKYTGFEAVS